MRIYFGNANYNPHFFEGSRTHITELISGLTARGVDIIVNPSSPVLNVDHLPEGRTQGLRCLLNCDLAYFRMQGTPVNLGFPFRNSRLRNVLDMPLVWEVNAVNTVDGGIDDEIDIPDADKLREFYGDPGRTIYAAICNTKGLAQFAADLGIQHVRRVPLGTNPFLFSRRRDVPPIMRDLKRKLNVVWIGSAGIRWHDFGTMTRAAQHLIAQPDIRFFIIGSEPQIHLPENVFWLGQRRQDELPSFLSSMDVGLAIYKKPSRSRYGVFSSPLKLFDYMGCGLTVVASPIEQALECIRQAENGFIVDFDDAQGLADTLIHVLNEGESRQRWGQVGRALVESYYNWGRVARETQEFFDEILGKWPKNQTIKKRFLERLCSIYTHVRHVQRADELR